MLTLHCKGLWWARPSQAHLSPVMDVDPGSHRQHCLRQIFNSLKVLSWPWEGKSECLALKPISILSFKYPVHKYSLQIPTVAPCAKNRKSWPCYITIQFTEPWENPLYGHRCWWNICVSCIPISIQSKQSLGHANHFQIKIMKGKKCTNWAEQILLKGCFYYHSFLNILTFCTVLTTAVFHMLKQPLKLL